MNGTAQSAMRVYCFMQAYIAKNGYPPTRSEMAAASGVGIDMIETHLGLLTARQLVRPGTGFWWKRTIYIH